MREIHPNQLRDLLTYDPGSGVLTWLPRPDNPAFNGQYAGKTAFTAINSSGYLHGKIFYGDVQAHRVAWALHHNEWPDGIIDHINGDPADNRIANLRVVDARGNSCNAAKNSLNTSGVIGVTWHSRDKAWQVTIRVGGGVRKYIGKFEHFEDAVAARKAAEREHGFHENHGRERIVSTA